MSQVYIVPSLCVLILSLVFSTGSYALPYTYYNHGNVYHYNGGYHYYNNGYWPKSTMIYGVPDEYYNGNYYPSDAYDATEQPSTTCTLQEKCYPSGDCNQVQVCN